MSNFLVELEQRAQRIADCVEDLDAQADQLRQVGLHLSAYIDFVRTNEQSQLDDAADEPDWAELSLPDALVEMARVTAASSEQLTPSPSWWRRRFARAMTTPGTASTAP